MRAVVLFAVSVALVAGILEGSARLTLAQAPATEQPAPPPAADKPDAAAPVQVPAQSPAQGPAISPVAPADTVAVPGPAAPAAPPAAAAPEPAPQPVVTAPPAEPAPAAAIANPPTPPAKPEPAANKTILQAARDLFAAKKLPTIGQAAAIGYYPRGCLQGGIELPVSGPTWQVMRLSRNRNWGHPSLVRFVEKFATVAAKATGWKGVLIGDMAQPRGGPTPTGHMSHQTGLDVDVWFMPMPDHRLTKQEREDVSAINVVADDWKHINPQIWTPQHIKFIKAAAEQPEVERVLVNAAIKKELCRVVGTTANWMKKVRPWYGHHDHIHVRLRCPDGSEQCRKQPPVPNESDDGCGKALDFWFSDKVLHPKIKLRPAKPLTLADLPPACKTVLSAPAVR